jgi:hypothetical protein
MNYVSAAAGTVALGLSLVSPAFAQGPGPSKVLSIIREDVKPARGVAHARAEEAYGRAFRAAKVPVYYIGMRSLTGSPQAWFVSSYDSYAAYEAENDLIAQNATLARQLEAADDEDAAYRTGQRNILAELIPELSYKPRSAKDLRYMDVTTIVVRPGHGQSFESVRKLLLEAHVKANIDEHWALYRVVSGMPGGTYLLLQGSTAMKEYDVDPHTQAYRDAIGDEGRKTIREMQREGALSAETVTFELSSQMSHVPAEWTTERPDFWKVPAARSTTAPAAAPKPALAP